MAKTIGVLLSLKDQFTTPLQKATKSVKTMDRQLEKAGNQIKAFGNRVKAGMKSVAKWAAIGFGALTAAAGVFIKQSIDAAKDKLKADKLLETNLMKQANFKKEHIQMLKDEASALQDVGVVGDDVAVAGAGQLAIYKLKAKQIKTILPIIDDMVAKEKGFNGTQEDAIAMADVFGKAVEGKTKGLVKYGVSLTDAEEKLFKTMKREQRAEFLNKKLTAAIGGTNKALRETDEGKIVAAKGAWGDMQAELGKKLMPKLGAIAEWFHSKIPAIQDFILSLADKVEELVTRAEPYITQIKDMFGKIFEKVKPALEETWQILSNAGTIAIDIAQNIINNWDRISPIVYTIVGAITAYNIAMTIRNNKELIYAGIIKSKMALDTAQALLTGQLTIKQWALNVAMKANPIGLVITAIALLVGGIWLLCKNWDLVKTKVKEFWARLENNPLGKMFKWFLRLTFPIILLIENFSTIKEKVIGFCKTLKDVFLKVWDAVVGAWNYAKEVISGVCDVLVGIFMPIWEAVSNGFNIAKDIILGVCDVLGGIFLEIWNGAINAWNFMKDTISDLCDTITNVFLKAWDGIMKALDAVLHPIETAKNAFGKLIDKLKFWNKTPADDKTINITENTKKTTETVGGANKTGVATTSIKNPRHALGTAYFKGGVTRINEGGRDETAILPAGTKILSHEEGKSLQKNNTEKQVIIKEVESKKSSDKKVEVHIHIGGNFIGEKEHMEKYGEYTANKILAALNNM
ncbi:phage tail protein [Fusobacterium animalis]|uniref:phage tail protein n=1 Tax=Fusobacterium animalis TaxID=76859 RepID=UPI0030CFA125